jgi:glucose-6-phosphate isomerase
MKSVIPTFDKLPSVIDLKTHYETVTKSKHLRDMLNDEFRNSQLKLKFGYEVILDLTHTKIDTKGIELLLEVAKHANIESQIKAMFDGQTINKTENR